MPNSAKITKLLKDATDGDNQALEQLYPQVYENLHRLAAKYMNRERKGHTLQATALVNEAFIRLADGQDVDWQSRNHFYAVAATVMRRILTDHAKAKHAAKRGGKDIRVSFDEKFHTSNRTEPGILELDDALNRLKEINERQARVVELRYFGGLNIEETAEVLQSSPATVKRDWATAKMWLYRELDKKTETE